jgi:hypothetical protein
MKAVAMMTPEPKYFATKKAHSGITGDLCRFAYTGNQAPGRLEVNKLDLKIPGYWETYQVESRLE